MQLFFSPNSLVEVGFKRNPIMGFLSFLNDAFSFYLKRGRVSFPHLCLHVPYSCEQINVESRLADSDKVPRELEIPDSHRDLSTSSSFKHLISTTSLVSLRATYFKISWLASVAALPSRSPT